LTVPSTAAASIGRANWRQQRRQFSTRRFDNFKPVVFYQFHAAGDNFGAFATLSAITGGQPNLAGAELLRT
jgi:hypothetical protein